VQIPTPVNRYFKWNRTYLAEMFDGIAHLLMFRRNKRSNGAPKYHASDLSRKLGSLSGNANSVSQISYEIQSLKIPYGGGAFIVLNVCL